MGSRIIFRFGKFKGKTIDEVPNWYLDFVVDKLDEQKYGEYIYAAEQELKWREKNDYFIEN